MKCEGGGEICLVEGLQLVRLDRKSWKGHARGHYGRRPLYGVRDVAIGFVLRVSVLCRCLNNSAVRGA